MPTIAMTARAVAALAVPSSGQADYWDADLPGFGLRVSYGGRRAWVLRYRVRGRLRRLTLGAYPHMTLADARRAARAALHAVATGADPAGDKQAERKAETVAELTAEYLQKHAKPQKRSWREDERILNADVLPHWRHKRVRELTRSDVRMLVESIAERGAPIMANRTLALVRKMLNFAIERDWLDANPAAIIPRPGREQARQRVLSEDELRRVWAAFEAEPLPLQAFCKLRLLTAQRGGEVRQMRWSDVADGWWTIPADHAKNGLSHRVPLSEGAIDLLRQLDEAADERRTWVFQSTRIVGPVTELKKVMRRVRIRSGVEFRGHDLRRTAASMMTSAGVSRLVVGRVLNHAEQGVTAVYDRHSYDAEKRAALDLWYRRVRQIVSGDQPGAKVVAFARVAEN